jgi:SpoIIAA-like
MRSSPGDTPIQERLGWLFWAIKTAGLHSHFLGLTCGLIRIGSGASAVGCGASAQAGPDPTERVRTTGRRTRKRVRATLRGFKSRRHRESGRNGWFRPYGTVDGEDVIKIIANMPTGTIGVEAVGKVTEEDYRDVLVPAISTALERNDVRLLYVLDEDFGSYSPGAMWADTKLWAQHLKAWKKIAIVSDADWLENSVKAFGWLIPGEVKVFETDDIDDAKEWLSGADDD